MPLFIRWFVSVVNKDTVLKHLNWKKKHPTQRLDIFLKHWGLQAIKTKWQFKPRSEEFDLIKVKYNIRRWYVRWCRFLILWNGLTWVNGSWVRKKISVCDQLDELHFLQTEQHINHSDLTATRNLYFLPSLKRNYNHSCFFSWILIGSLIRGVTLLTENLTGVACEQLIPAAAMTSEERQRLTAKLPADSDQ